MNENNTICNSFEDIINSISQKIDYELEVLQRKLPDQNNKNNEIFTSTAILIKITILKALFSIQNDSQLFEQIRYNSKYKEFVGIKECDSPNLKEWFNKYISDVLSFPLYSDVYLSIAKHIRIQTYQNQSFNVDFEYLNFLTNNRLCKPREFQEKTYSLNTIEFGDCIHKKPSSSNDVNLREKKNALISASKEIVKSFSISECNEFCKAINETAYIAGLPIKVLNEYPNEISQPPPMKETYEDLYKELESVPGLQAVLEKKEIWLIIAKKTEKEHIPEDKKALFTWLEFNHSIAITHFNNKKENFWIKLLTKNSNYYFFFYPTSYDSSFEAEPEIFSKLPQNIIDKYKKRFNKLGCLLHYIAVYDSSKKQYVASIRIFENRTDSGNVFRYIFLPIEQEFYYDCDYKRFLQSYIVKNVINFNVAETNSKNILQLYKELNKITIKGLQKFKNVKASLLCSNEECIYHKKKKYYFDYKKGTTLCHRCRYLYPNKLHKRTSRNKSTKK